MATMNTSQRLPVTITVTKADGSAGEVQNMAWASSDETIIAPEMAADGLTGFVNAVAASDNTARLVCTGDADLGAGIVPLIGTSEDITVTQDPATQASSIVISFGAPEAKPAGGVALG